MIGSRLWINTRTGAIHNVENDGLSHSAFVEARREQFGIPPHVNYRDEDGAIDFDQIIWDGYRLGWVRVSDDARIGRGANEDGLSFSGKSMEDVRAALNVFFHEGGHADPVMIEVEPRPGQYSYKVLRGPEINRFVRSGAIR